jgi:UDP-N-acetylglucosamine 2-epimerase (non-hydrolysing)
MQKLIVNVVGARPNFMKVAALERGLQKISRLRTCTVHTGQHYDPEMSDVFFRQLSLSLPERSLGVGSGGHGYMTGRIMVEFEKACEELLPDLVVVVGDVNSTVAAALVARKLSIPVAHVEAGLRSFDESMPEELNRKLTDTLSNLLFVSEPSGVDNLQREGIDMDRVHLVGDIMLETLSMFLPAIQRRQRWVQLGLERGSYGLATIHRPSNVDDPRHLCEVLDILEMLTLPVVFPAHPRTVKHLEEFGLMERVCTMTHLHMLPPESYLDFLSLLEGAKLLFSDSGSVQAEASFLNVPCLVCRENTERPIYVEEGTSVLVGRDKERIAEIMSVIGENRFRASSETVARLGLDVSRKITEILNDFLV